MSRRDTHVFFGGVPSAEGGARSAIDSRWVATAPPIFKKKSILGVFSILRLYQLGPSPKGGTGTGCRSCDYVTQPELCSLYSSATKEE